MGTLKKATQTLTDVLDATFSTRIVVHNYRFSHQKERKCCLLLLVPLSLFAFIVCRSVKLRHLSGLCMFFNMII